ncbi:MAG: DEAD/DEAH box helicase [Kurthia sp.]|nr:DEAD/DEAH box helicase [Candidatus Kurthia equi]
MRIRHLPSKIPFPLVDPQLQSFLSGRIWLEDHLPFLNQTIQYHIKYKLIERQSGIQQKRCRRCHSQHLYPFFCSKCQGPCSYCLDCFNMGRISNCSQLVQWTGPKIKQSEQPKMTWNGQLTPAQQRVVNECLAMSTDYLIHAVTGAGKTEMLFPLIESSLQQGKRVCLATPRTDVVLELLPRLQQAFQKTEVQAFYGGSGHPKQYAPLVLATTHQLLRFEHTFDLILVDEADAFPYSYDKKLQYAVQKAKNEKARTIIVTATPTKKQRQLYLHNKSYSFLARRFHGADLPTPQYESLWSYERKLRKGKLPKKLAQWIQQCLQQKKPFLLFFPTIELMHIALPLIQAYDASIQAVHAKEELRKPYVQQLRDGQVSGLLTTTILERGITIANLQVAIVGAERRIFHAHALIQISGRVGRSKEMPTGQVIFYHHGITKQMDAACDEIRRLNEIGDDNG